MDELASGGHAVRITALDLRIGARLLLQNVSIQVPVNSRLGVTGPSGVGKSTLLRAVVSGALPVTSAAKEFFVRKHAIGYAPQGGGLFPWYTVRRNLEFSWRHRFCERWEGEPSEVRAVEGIAEDFGLGATLDTFPSQISGGERQRVVLACAVLQHPDLFVIDEPLTGVDTRNKWLCLEQVSRAISSRSASCLVVSHDVEVLSYLCDEVLVIGGSPGAVVARFHMEGDHPRSRMSLFEAPLIRDRESLFKYMLRN